MNIEIKVMMIHPYVSTPKTFTINGTINYEQSQLITEDIQLTEHDIASCLFAIEFAANGQEQVPMRVHIKNV